MVVEIVAARFQRAEEPVCQSLCVSSPSPSGSDNEETAKPHQRDRHAGLSMFGVGSSFAP